LKRVAFGQCLQKKAEAHRNGVAPTLLSHQVTGRSPCVARMRLSISLKFNAL